MDIESKRADERKLYEKIYSSKRRYGGVNHASGILDKIKKMKISSLVDVGCGHGQFAEWCCSIGIPTVLSRDFAAPGPKKSPAKEGFLKAPAHDLQIDDASVEYVTSFDMMEHLVPEDTITVLNEFDRVASKGFIFSICYRPSFHTVDGRNLHPNVHPESWWVQLLSDYGDVTLYKEYIIVTKRP